VEGNAKELASESKNKLMQCFWVVCALLNFI